MRYRLRTLLIVLAIGPILLAWGWWEYAKYRERQRVREALAAEQAELQLLLKGPRYPQPPHW